VRHSFIIGDGYGFAACCCQERAVVGVVQISQPWDLPTLCLGSPGRHKNADASAFLVRTSSHLIIYTVVPEAAKPDTFPSFSEGIEPAVAKRDLGVLHERTPVSLLWQPLG
jgi:hypothetical protein